MALNEIHNNPRVDISLDTEEATSTSKAQADILFVIHVLSFPAKAGVRLR
jgi:hypothetical protein